MYPLMEPTLDALAEQIYQKQSTEGITYEDDNKYTSMLLFRGNQNGTVKGSAAVLILFVLKLLYLIHPDAHTGIARHPPVSSRGDCHATDLRTIRQAGALELL